MRGVKRLTRAFTLLSCCQAKTLRLSLKGENYVMACFQPSVLILGHSFVRRLHSDLRLGFDVRADESLESLSLRHF